MYRKKTFFTLLLLFTIVFNSNAHEDKTIIKSFDNIKVIFITGYYYEEINKALIIGEYAKQLSSKLGFNNQITIFFNHIYTEFQPKSYIIKHDAENSNDKVNEIYLKLYDDNYDIKSILKLVEYSIKNISTINDTDGLEILNNCKISKLLKNILSKKVYRPLFVEELSIKNRGISYYYQNNRFHIYIKTSDTDKIVKSLSNIYQFSKIDDYSNIVFDTDKTFYIFQNTNLDDKLNQYKIEDLDAFTEPYNIKLLTPNILSLSLFSKPNIRKDRVILFLIKEKRIIQNLKLVLDKI